MSQLNKNIETTKKYTKETTEKSTKERFLTTFENQKLGTTFENQKLGTTFENQKLGTTFDNSINNILNPITEKKNNTTTTQTITKKKSVSVLIPIPEKRLQVPKRTISKTDENKDQNKKITKEKVKEISNEISNEINNEVTNKPVETVKNDEVIITDLIKEKEFTENFLNLKKLNDTLDDKSKDPENIINTIIYIHDWLATNNKDPRSIEALVMSVSMIVKLSLLLSNHVVEIKKGLLEKENIIENLKMEIIKNISNKSLYDSREEKIVNQQKLINNLTIQIKSIMNYNIDLLNVMNDFTK